MDVFVSFISLVPKPTMIPSKSKGRRAVILADVMPGKAFRQRRLLFGTAVSYFQQFNLRYPWELSETESRDEFVVVIVISERDEGNFKTFSRLENSS